MIRGRAFFSIFRCIISGLLIRLNTWDRDERELYFTAYGSDKAIETKRMTNLAPSEASFNHLASIGTLTFIRGKATRHLFFRVIVMAISRNYLFFRFFFKRLYLRFFTSNVRDVRTFILILISKDNGNVDLIMTDIIGNLARFFIIRFITVFTFRNETCFFYRFRLYLTLGLGNFIYNLRHFRRILLKGLIRFTFRRRSIFMDNTRRRIRVNLF